MPNAYADGRHYAFDAALFDAREVRERFGRKDPRLFATDTTPGCMTRTGAAAAS